MKSGVLPKIGLVLAFAAAASGCVQTIGPAASNPDLRGTTTLTHVFAGGPKQASTTIDAAALKPSKIYNGEGQIVIQGSVPAGATINVESGRLIVTGDVADGAKINVTQPTLSHTETYAGHCYTHTLRGRFEYAYSLHCKQTVTDGLKYNDSKPAVEIKGTIGRGVQIAAPGQITVNGRNVENPGRIFPAVMAPVG